MNCSWIRKRLSTYLDDQLCPLDVKKVEKHLSYCKECQLELKKLDTVSKMVGSLEDFSPPQGFANSVFTNTTRTEELYKSDKSILDNIFTLKNVAAVLIGMLIVGNGLIFAFFQEPSGETTAEHDRIEEEIELTEAERQELANKLTGVLNNDYLDSSESDADFSKASSISESLDLSKYDENGTDEDEVADTTPFLVFNGMYLPIAASMVFIMKNRYRGD